MRIESLLNFVSNVKVRCLLSNDKTAFKECKFEINGLLLEGGTDRVDPCGGSENAPCWNWPLPFIDTGSDVQPVMITINMECYINGA